MISREPSREPSSTQINSISMGTERTFWTTSRSVARSLYTGITTESFMARLREGETPPESITIVNCVCDDARVRIQESVKDLPASRLARPAGRGRPALHQQLGYRRGVGTPPGLYSDFARSNAADVRDTIIVKISL